MKTIRLLLLFLSAVTLARAINSTTGGYTTLPVTVTSAAYSLDFAIEWSCDDYPASSAPGRIELLDSGGNFVARVVASVYRGSGPSTAVTSPGSVSNVSYWMARYAADGSPADGNLQGTWNLTGLAPGNYTLRLWGYTTYTVGRQATTVWTSASFLSGYPTPGQNSAPAINWSSAPASAGDGQSYTITTQAHDDDGNLAQVNVWKNDQPFAFAGGGDGTDGNSGNTTSDTGPQTITFTAQAVDADGAMSPVITQVVTIDPPVNNPPVVTLLSPVAQTITAGTTLTITSHATDSDGNLTSHNLDIQRPAGDWNFQGGFATGEPFQGGPVGSGADSTRSASFTFTDAGTYQVRSAANDGSGWVQSTTVAITVVAPPPVQYSLVTSAGTGGTVSSGGTYNAGTVVSLTATPDGTHDFAGWSGDAVGTGNPVSLVIDGNKAVQANFSPKVYVLTTSASTGGSVTPGGTYPYGTSVTVSATPDATHAFIGWAGDASGSAPSILLTLTSPLNVQAVFTDKTAQTITFPSPGNQPVGGPAVTLGGSASSGLPITYTVLSGPATISGNQLTITGPGAVTVQAGQPGDATYLPAPNVTQTFNTVTAAFLKYRPTGRTLLQADAATGTAPFVLEKP